MNVGILTAWAPFQRGGAELLADRLALELRVAGHRATVIEMPLRWRTLDDVEDAIAVARLQQLAVDRMIGLKFPGYLVEHDEKVLWILHQFRQVYDLWGTPHGGVPGDPGWERVRQLVRRADDSCFRSARATYVNSSTTARRMSLGNAHQAQVLHPPPVHELRPLGALGDQFVALGRISAGKRQALAIEALALAPPGTRLVVAGPPDDDRVATDLERLVEHHGLADRVTIIARFISDEEKEALLRGARAVLCLPIDEDSFSYVALEAASAGRPVITVSDAGGVLGLVRDGDTGLVAEPTPAAVAAAMAALAADPRRATALGDAGAALAPGFTPQWAEVVEVLLS